MSGSLTGESQAFVLVSDLPGALSQWRSHERSHVSKSRRYLAVLRSRRQAGIPLDWGLERLEKQRWKQMVAFQFLAPGLPYL